ncbi:MAG: MarR family winged helix-turn-helix transcriptional regulator [Acidimicrobiales bacterium]
MTDATTPRWLDETQQEAWRGLRAVMFRAFPEMERTLKAHDLLAVHYHIFAVLSDAPDQTLRLSELADSANMSQSRLTHRLRVLVERGEIDVYEDPDDRRAKNAKLTKAGRRRLEHLAPIHSEDVQRLIFDPLTPEQTKALADATTTIADHLCHHPEFLNPQSC